MPRVVARYIAWNPRSPADRADFITCVAAAIQCWKTPRRGHNSGTVARQDALDTGSQDRDLHQARRFMASIVQAPVIQAPAVPGACRHDRTRPAARSVSRARALADLSRSHSEQHRRPGSPSAITASATRPKSSSSFPATPRPSSTAAPWSSAASSSPARASCKRAWQIYVAHIFLFAIYIAEIAYVASSFENPLYVEEMNALDFLKTAGRHDHPGAAAQVQAGQHGRAAALHRAAAAVPAGAVAADPQRHGRAGGFGRALCADLGVRLEHAVLSERALVLQSVRLAAAVRVRRLVRARRRDAARAGVALAGHGAGSRSPICCSRSASR